MTLGVLRRAQRSLAPSQLLFRQYRLDKSERFWMTLRGIIMSQLANPVGSAVYFLTTQVAYQTKYSTTVITWWSLKDPWDRLPIHLQNGLNALGARIHWFHSQDAPPTWVVARHDFRYVMIGALAVLMVKSVTVGLGKRDRKPVSNWRIITSPITIPAVAIICAIPGILFFTHVWPGIARHGLLDSNPYFGNWTGAGKWQLVLIGITAGLGAKLLFTPVAASLQLVSIDKKLIAGVHPRRWWGQVYGPAYVKRFEFLRASMSSPAADRHTPIEHGRALGVFLTVSALLFTVFLAFGIWLRYFGPAKGA